MTEVTSRLSSALADRYKIERRLGEGGMATVYLAEDLKHKRKVAVKVLRPELAAVLGAERFVQEITTTANLQHPHILPLFDSGEADSFLYYVMPFIDGETLRDKLNREKQLSIEEAVKITTDVADALHYAHGEGVIHRDIKPENILIHNGRPIVADFGIALAVSAAAGGRMTETGLSLGTPHYMSPEQATAERDITSRSDIYSLGAMLYEMLTGDPPHTGSSAQQIIMKIVTEEVPSVMKLRKTVPSNVAAATAKSLEKLAADRFTSAAKFAEALTNPAFAFINTATTYPIRPRLWSRWAAAALAGVAVFVAGVWTARTWLNPGVASEPQPLVQFTVTAGRIGEPWPNAPIALAPDGSALVYTGFNDSRIWQLFVYRTDRDELQPIPGTEDGSLPFFSPSGEWVGFYQYGSLRKVPLNGGRVVTLAEVEPSWGQLMFGSIEDATWGADDTIVFVRDGQLFRVAATSGESPALLAAPDSGLGVRRYRAARFIGDSRDLVVAFEGGDNTTVLGILSLDVPRVVPLELVGTAPRYVQPGYLIFADFEGALLAIAFDPRRLGTHGAPFPVTAVLTRSQVAVVSHRGGGGPGLFDVSQSGLLVFGTRLERDNEVVLVDRNATVQVLPIERAGWRHPRFSPDGNRLVLERAGELWTYDLASSRLNPLLADSVNHAPEWTADGDFLYFSRGSDGIRRLFRIKEDGSGTPELLHTGAESLFQFQLSPDGSRLVFQCHLSSSRDICVVTVGSEAKPEPLLATPADEANPTLSPDGRWLAFVSNVSGQNEVYLRRLSREGPNWPVSVRGGTEPRWARDGSELFFRHGDSLLAARLSLTGEPRISEPTPIFSGHLTPENTYGSHFDAAPDGARWVMLRPVGGESPLEFHFLLNWLDRVRPSPDGGSR